jgi:hypothetical protein
MGDAMYYLFIHMVASSIVYIDLRMMNLPILSTRNNTIL